MKYNFCLECAAPLAKQNATDYVCANGHMFWNNPKGTATVLFIQDNQVLLSKRAIEPFKGKFDTPGGFINYGENPYDAARREMKEETGVDLLEVSLFEVFSNEYGDWGVATTDIFFVCRSWRGEFKPQDDVAELIWKPIDFLGEREQLAWPIDNMPNKVRRFLVRNPVQ